MRPYSKYISFVYRLFAVMLVTFSTAASAIELNSSSPIEHGFEGQSIVIGLTNNEHSDSLMTKEDRDLLMSMLTEYWSYWGDVYGLNVRFVSDTQENLTLALELGDVDILSMSTFNGIRRFNFHYSIPYIEIQGALYKKLNKSTDTPKVALNLPNGVKPTTLNELLPIVVQSPDIDTVLRAAMSVDYIYTWNTKTFYQALLSAGLHTEFVKLENAHHIPIRAAVKEQNHELLDIINHGIRHLDVQVVDKIYNEFDSSHDITFKHLVGSYLTNLTPVQERLISQRPVMTYAHLSIGEEPYFLSEDFYYEGYMTDVMRQLQDKLGVTFEPIAYYSFQEALDAINSDKVDIFPGIYQTETREDTLTFTNHVDSASLAIVSEGDFYSLSQLEGKRLASVRGFHENELVSETLKNNPIIYLDSARDAMIAVAEGHADAYVGKLLNSAYIINQEELHTLNIHKADDFNYQFLPRLALPKRERNFISLLNLGLHSLGPDFQADMQAKWKKNLFLAEESEKVRALYNNILIAGAFVAVFMLFLFMFHRYQLNKRNNIQQSLEFALKEAEKAKREAEEMTLAKSDFLARMSHEIRTPMNGVLGMAEAISFTKLNKEQADLLHTLNGSARNLMALLNDVLDFSKMDAGKLTLETMSCDVSTLLTSVIGNFKHKANAKNLEMTSRMDSHLQRSYMCDSTRLMQVLNNLVSNSVKFTDKGYIELSAQLITQDFKVTDDGVHIDLIGFHVRDSGIGVPQEKLDSLFDPFVQADGDITRKFGGTGLGLSICKEIISEMGGDIRVSSVIGHGSLFSITIPFAVDRSSESLSSNDTRRTTSQEKGEVKELSQLKVLFAEDNEVNRKVIGGQLKRLGVTYDEAENGKIAHEMYLSDPTYDIVLSDCHMPEMDGFALAGEISRTRKNQKPYLIAITADALSGAAKRCKDSGFDDYISKPCPMDILESKLYDAAVSAHSDMSDFSSGDSSLTDWLDANSSEPHEYTELSDEIVQEDPMSWLESSFDAGSEYENVDDLSWLSEFEDAVATTQSVEHSDINKQSTSSLTEELDADGWDEAGQAGEFKLLSGKVEQITQEDSDSVDTIDDPFDDMFEAIEQPDISPEYDQDLLHDLNSFLEDTAGTELTEAPDFDAEFEAFLSQDLTQDTFETIEETDDPLSDILAELSQDAGANESIGELPEFEAFEPAHVLAMSGEDEEIAGDILDSFIAAYPRDIKELSEVFERGDIAQLKDTAHRIKGSTLYLGNTPLSETAKALEHESAKGSIEFAKERVEFVCQGLEQLGQEVEVYRATMGVTG